MPKFVKYHPLVYFLPDCKRQCAELIENKHKKRTTTWKVEWIKLKMAFVRWDEKFFFSHIRISCSKLGGGGSDGGCGGDVNEKWTKCWIKREMGKRVRKNNSSSMHLFLMTANSPAFGNSCNPRCKSQHSVAML